MASKNWKRPESVLVVIHSQDRVLLLRRKDVADFWQSVTGSLDWEETPLQAAWRELREETGLGEEHGVLRDCQQQNRFPIVPPWRVRYAPEIKENLEHVFIFILPAPRNIHLNPAEHTEYLWLPREQAADQASSYTNREAILACVQV